MRKWVRKEDTRGYWWTLTVGRKTYYVANGSGTIWNSHILTITGSTDDRVKALYQTHVYGRTYRANTSG